MKYTPWFDGSVKPVRDGVYETDSLGSKKACYQHWNGIFWGLASTSPFIAFARKDDMSSFQNDKWRGLKTKDGK